MKLHAILNCYHSMKANGAAFFCSVALFIILYKLVLTFEFVWILWMKFYRVPIQMKATDPYFLWWYYLLSC